MNVLCILEDVTDGPVIKIVKWANETGIPLWPISIGRNVREKPLL